MRVFALTLLLPLHASAATVAVVVDSSGGELDREATRSMVWHALYDRYGHDAQMADSKDAAIEMMDELELTTLYTFEITWEPLVVRVPQRGAVASLAPEIQTREYVRSETGLQVKGIWNTHGALALYDELQEDGSIRVVAMPQVAMQEAIDLAVHPLDPPLWHAIRTRVKVPVTIAADEEYRAFYGAKWKEVADLRVERASALLAQAGIELDVVDHEGWQSPDDQLGLSELLDTVAALPRRHPGAIRVAFTQQTNLATNQGASIEDVGRVVLGHLQFAHLGLREQEQAFVRVDEIFCHGFVLIASLDGSAVCRRLNRFMASMTPCPAQQTVASTASSSPGSSISR